jgi:hypothetical protein
MNVIARLTIKMPTWRVRAVRLAILVLAPFVRSEAAGQYIGNAMFAWVRRGFVVSVEGLK